MPRYKLKEAREKAGLTQSALADLVGCERKAPNYWEAGTASPRGIYREKILEVLKDVLKDVLTEEDNDLFKNYPERPSERTISSTANICPQLDSNQPLSTPCQPATNHAILESTDPCSFVISGSDKELSLMDKLRRAINKAVGATLVGVNLQIITAPFIPSESHTGATIPPEESLPQCTFIIESCWEWFYQANYNKVERGIQRTMPTLRRLANTPGPYQHMAASLAVQANIMQISLANRSLNFIERENYCIEAVHFGELSGNRDLLAIAQSWYGDTFTYCYDQPLQAIDILNTALFCLDNETLRSSKDIQQRKDSRVYTPSLVRSNIYSTLSIAHAQIENETNIKENEELSRDYAEMARLTLPKCPELDPLYKYVRMGSSELDQFDGKAQLYLAQRTHNRKYAELARDAFDKAISKQANSRSFLGQAYIRRADAARVLGEMDGFVGDLAEGLRIGVELDRLITLIQASNVLSNMLPEWKQEAAVQKLQKEIVHAIKERSQSIVIARR